MTYRAIYAYPWDLAETGVAAVVDEVRGLGLDTVTLTAAYHAGKFLRPRGRHGKVYFPEDGTAYFKTRPDRYGTIKPVENSLVAERDILGELGSSKDIAANAWMVLLHNTRLGTMHPQATVANAFGDRYVYSLCPSAPDARDYAVALCADLTDRYPVGGISLETPGFQPYVHGFHHEFALVRPNRWLDMLLGLCFCEHCVRGATAAGVDAGRLRTWVCDAVDGYLRSDIDLPADMAEAIWLADCLTDADLSAFLRWRCGVVTTLVGAIRAEVRPDATVAVIPSVARPSAGAWYEGSDLHGLAEAAGVVEVCFYEPSPDRIRADLWDVQRRLGGAGRLRGILRPAHPDLNSRAAVVEAVAVLRAAGVDDIAFYNYGHIRPASLAWIAAAMADGEH